LADGEPPVVAERIVEWWAARNRTTFEGRLRSDIFPIVATRAEIVTALLRLKWLTEGDQSSRIAWNAQPNMRLVSSLVRLVDLVEQPHLIATRVLAGGFELCVADDSSEPETGAAGLMTALEDIVTLQGKWNRRFCIPICLEASGVRAAVLERAGHADQVRLLEDVEHSVRLSIARLAAQRAGGTPNGLPDPDRETVGLHLEDLRRQRLVERPQVAAAKTGEEGLACLVMSRLPNRRSGRIEFCQWFDGSFDEALRRVEALLQYRFEKSGLCRRWTKRASGGKPARQGWGRLTTILQESMIRPALAEEGDLGAERAVLRAAWECAEKARSSGEVAIGIGRVARGDHDPWKHRTEVEAVIDFWKKSKDERRVLRQAARNYGWSIWLDAHEKSRWTLRSRPAQQPATSGFTTRSVNGSVEPLA
jgi:hypothetical protein